MLFEENKNRKSLTIFYFILFVALEMLVVTNNQILASFDMTIQNAIAPLVTSTRTSIFVLISFLGSPVMSFILAMFIAMLLYSRKRKVDAIWVFLTYLGGNAIAFVVKEIVRRPRPVDKVVSDSGFSFPSGHIFGLTLLILIAIYLLLPYIKNQEFQFMLVVVMVLWLLMVAFSRLYLRGHYISDIFGSVTLAAAWWESAELLYIRYAQKLDEFLELRLKKAND